MIARMRVAVDFAARRDLAARKRSAKHYNQRRYQPEFAVGDLVWVWAESKTSNSPDHSRRSLALVNRCHGPWRITERQDDLHYLATHLRTGANDKFTVDFLVPAHYPAEPDESDSDSEDFPDSDDDFDDVDDPDWTYPL
jgi:hypothetical protein